MNVPGLSSNLSKYVFPDNEAMLALGRVTEGHWAQVLTRIGFREDPLDGIGRLFENRWFLVGFSCVGDMTGFGAAVKRKIEPGKDIVTTNWEVKGYDDLNTMEFLRALTEPQLLPTLIGIPWAGTLIENWLEEQ